MKRQAMFYHKLGWSWAAHPLLAKRVFSLGTCSQPCPHCRLTNTAGNLLQADESLPGQTLTQLLHHRTCTLASEVPTAMCVLSAAQATLVM
jgi:hypothetical protein